MRFEAEMKLTYRQLLALYTVSEKLFRRKQMLLFRVLFLAIGVWRTWTAWEQVTADGMSFRRVSYLMIGILFLIAGLIPNLVSAAFARMRAIYTGKILFEGSCLYEVIGDQKIRHNYDKVYALVYYRGYDFIFLDPLASLVVRLDEIPGRDPEELRRFLSEQCNKPYQRV